MMVFIRFLIFIKTLKNRSSQMIKEGIQENSHNWLQIKTTAYKQRLDRRVVRGTRQQYSEMKYQDKFKPVFFFVFFTKSFCTFHKKSQNVRQTTFILLEVCACKKLLPQFFSVCLVFFCCLFFASECFCMREFFSKNAKTNKYINK